MKKKSTFNPKIHRRKSIRLKGYNYTRAGLYFITMCCQDRACMFGEIIGVGDLAGPPQRILNNRNDAGKMIEKWYYELENKFPDIKCHEMVVMPNHFHCIVEITAGAKLGFCPKNGKISDNLSGGENRNLGGEQSGSLIPDSTQPVGNKTNSILPGEHKGSSLYAVVQWFKTMTTNEYIRGVKTLKWKPFNGKLWQRNYYECIIRSELSYFRISRYIRNNPKKWAENLFYKRRYEVDSP
jgi:REP element-mobilizing transposase RayT